ncbi:MAG: TonB family protein [Terracidiphilus sp.]
MAVKATPERATFGLLPEPERSTTSFLVSAAINGLILAVLLYLGAAAKKAMDLHQYQETLLMLPSKPAPPPPKVKIAPLPPVAPPRMTAIRFQPPKIDLPKLEPKPALKVIQIAPKLPAPSMQASRAAIILAPQPKPALAAAMPAETPQFRPSTGPVHLGRAFGVLPNPGAMRPATVAALGNRYGGLSGPVAAPRGIVGSAGFGNSRRLGSNAGTAGKVASAGIPGAVSAVPLPGLRRVAAAGISAAPVAPVRPRGGDGKVAFTSLEVLSKPPVRYTSEAKRLKIQGEVVLKVTFTANGQVVVRDVVRGLGHGLDQEAERVAQQIRFRPATRDGRPVDLTTDITITFQLA